MKHLSLLEGDTEGGIVNLFLKQLLNKRLTFKLLQKIN